MLRQREMACVAMLVGIIGGDADGSPRTNVDRFANSSRAHGLSTELEYWSHAVATIFIVTNVIPNADSDLVLERLWLQECLVIGRYRSRYAPPNHLQLQRVSDFKTALRMLRKIDWVGIIGIECDRAYFETGKVAHFSGSAWI